MADHKLLTAADLAEIRRVRSSIGCLDEPARQRTRVFLSSSIVPLLDEIDRLRGHAEAMAVELTSRYEHSAALDAYRRDYPKKENTDAR